jgi:hypothetical protein
VAHFLLMSAVMLVSERPGLDQVGDGAPDEYQRKQGALANLSPDRYPHVVAMAGDLVACVDPDDYFRQGIDMVLLGIEARSAAAVGDR